MIQTVFSYAKINLFLYVTGRREDGYHTLRSLMTRIDLHDELTLDFTQNEVCVSCSHPFVPEDESNLVCKAASLYFDAAGLTQKGLGIKIVKQIPPGGGLGGGSSNAATVLKYLNAYYNHLLSTEKLKELGLQIGADVPFFIDGRPSIATGIGERLEPFEITAPFWLVLCSPGILASTADVYKNIDFRLTEKSKYYMNTGLNMPTRGQGFDIKGLLHNDLEEPACRLYPKIRQTKEEMALLLNKDVYMTGSGSSLFALYSDQKKAAQGFESLKKRWAGTDKEIFFSSFV